MTATGVSERVEIVRELYDLLDERAFEEYVSRFAEDAAWIEPEGSRFGGTYRGREEIHDLLSSTVGGDWSEFRVDVDRILEDGRTVVVLTTTSGTFGETGNSMTTRAAHVYDFEDGAIERMESFEDTAALHRAMD